MKQHIFVVILLAASAWGLSVARTEGAATYHQLQTYEDVYYLPSAQALRWISLGHRQALADLIWIRALIYFGDEVKHKGRVAHVFRYGDTIVRLDPSFREVYAWVSRTSIYHHGKVTAGLVKRAIAFVRRGVRRFPNDGELAWELGATLAYELAPLMEATPEKTKIREEALGHLITAARLGAGPPWLTMFNATQLSKLGKQEQAVRHLSEMYSATRDPAVKESIAARIAMLQSDAQMEAMRLSVARIEEERRARLPFVPLDLYLLVRDPDAHADAWTP